MYADLVGSRDEAPVGIGVARGSRGRCHSAQDWTATKVIVVSVVHTTSQSHFFFSTRSVLWPRICRKCICGMGFAPDPTGELTTFPQNP